MAVKNNDGYYTLGLDYGDNEDRTTIPGTYLSQAGRTYRQVGRLGSFDFTDGTNHYNKAEDTADPEVAKAGEQLKAGGDKPVMGGGIGGSLASMNPYLFVAAAALQYFTGVHQAMTIREQNALNDRINNMNADAAEIDAHNAEKHAVEEIANYQPTIDQTIGAQRVAYASQNVDVNFGTAAEIQSETRVTGAMNIMRMQQEANARVLGLKRQVRDIRLGGLMKNASGDIAAEGARTQGILNASTTLVSGYARRY